ncbi:hypothetical protein COOONC_26793 [Cooperia oncophora]
MSNAVTMLFWNYGTAYTAAAAAAAVYGNLGVAGQVAHRISSPASDSKQRVRTSYISGHCIISTEIFRSTTTNPYATYNTSVAASYGYGTQSTNAASMYAAQAAQAAQAVQAQAQAQAAQVQAQVQATQVSRLSADAAYAAAAQAAPTQYSTFGTTGQIAGRN